VWQNLALAEQKQSQAFTKLASDQGSIITELTAGKSPSSNEVKTILKEVRDTQQALADANAEAAKLRSELIKL
jgi:gas vesicle protein